LHLGLHNAAAAARCRAREGLGATRAGARGGGERDLLRLRPERAKLGAAPLQHRE